METRRAQRVLGLAGLVGSSLWATGALAQDPRGVVRPRFLAEPVEVTQVADAFDGNNPFDLRLSAGYAQSWKAAEIRRETSISQDGLTTGGITSRNLNVAKYEETTSRLDTRAELGLYHDLALVIRLPIILANDRELESLEGSGLVQSTVLAGLPGEQLFSLPFKSPTRSGIEYLALGIDVGLSNQMRNPSSPTWVIGAEGRFDVGDPMHACNANPRPLNLENAQVRCAHPSDVNRNGTPRDVSAGGVDLEGSFSGSRRPGVSRGTTGLELHTYLSRRVKHFEPYGGFTALFEFGNDSSDYGNTQGVSSVLINRPPMQGSVIVGVGVIPWQARADFERITLDFRATGTYVSEGRDYSELFDALGSSDAPSLRNPNFAEYRANPDFPSATGAPSIVNPASAKLYMDGLSDVQQHSKLKLSTQFTWQPGEYLKFNLGGGLEFVQSHVITYDQACSTSGKLTVGAAGPCRRESQGAFLATGKPNPAFRRSINDPGRRFVVDGSRTFDVWLNVVLML